MSAAQQAGEATPPAAIAIAEKTGSQRRCFPVVISMSWLLRTTDCPEFDADVSTR
jgi:hypothetical protein